MMYWNFQMIRVCLWVVALLLANLGLGMAKDGTDIKFADRLLVAAGTVFLGTELIADNVVVWSVLYGLALFYCLSIFPVTRSVLKWALFD